MPHQKASFKWIMPAIEVRRGHVFITVHGQDEALCSSVHDFEAFLEAGRRAIADWHAGQAPAVLPFKRPGG